MVLNRRTVNDMTTDITPLITDACALRALLNARLSGLYSNPSGSENMLKVLTMQYAPAINKIVAATTKDELAERRMLLDVRLHNGWSYCALHPDDEAAYDLWEAVLVEYMVVDDALNHAEIEAGTRERVYWIREIVPMVQGSLV